MGEVRNKVKENVRLSWKVANIWGTLVYGVINNIECMIMELNTKIDNFLGYEDYQRRRKGK